jgi:predicted ATPase with chaperone activity
MENDWNQTLELPAPRFAATLDDLDVSAAFLADLALKTASLEAEPTTSSVARSLQLGMFVTDLLMDRLYNEKLVEKKGTVGLHNHRFQLTDRGWNRLSQSLEICGYVGPAPVSLESYTEMMVSQVRGRPPVSPAALDRALRELVLPENVRRRLALVASSGRSLFLSGPPGNGKTAMARALVQALGGAVWIPYAIEVDGHVIRVFSKHDHHPVDVPASLEYDRRWVKIRPPLVSAGGELTIESLDLTYTQTPRFYEAPSQVKANGGVLVIDDFGRQRVSPRELLNRWIVPLEYRTDNLTLRTGKKIQVPFEMIVIFATNLTGADLLDAAFLRRMGYRLEVHPPTPETYTEIFLRCAQALGVAADLTLTEQLVRRYQQENRPMMACEPRDLILRAMDICKFDGRPFELTPAILDEAWDSYFGGHSFAPPPSPA